MKVEYTYNVCVTVDEDKGESVEKALLVAARAFNPSASVDEIAAIEIEDEEEETT